VEGQGNISLRAGGRIGGIGGVGNRGLLIGQGLVLHVSCVLRSVCDAGAELRAVLQDEEGKGKVQ
jgi:hypothetical protein